MNRCLMLLEHARRSLAPRPVVPSRTLAEEQLSDIKIVALYLAFGFLAWCLAALAAV